MPLTRFFQSCPVCGRGVLIPVECLGQQVSCRHCQGRFQARDTSSAPGQRELPESTALDRANALLAGAMSQRRSYRPAGFPNFSE